MDQERRISSDQATIKAEWRHVQRHLAIHSSLDSEPRNIKGMEQPSGVASWSPSVCTVGVPLTIAEGEIYWYYLIAADAG